MKKVLKYLSGMLSVFLCVLLALQVIPLNSNVIDAVGKLFAVNANAAENAADESTSDILYELTDERTADSKTFVRSDGTKAIAVYPYEIHFENENGEFTEYDNTLLESTDSEGENEYSAEESDIDIRISKKTNGKKLVRVTKDKYTLSWNYTDINKVTGEASEKTEDEDKTTLENMTGEVIFSDVFTDTDLQYILFGNSLKENIILNSPDAPASFTAEYKYSSLTPTLSEDKRTVYLSDSEGKVIFEISAPYMTDSDGNESNNLHYELSEVKNNSFRLTLITDKDWLSSPDRAYPITVDPIILTKQTWDQSNYQSAYISSAMPDACFGKNSVTGNYEGSLYVGYENGRQKVRSLIQFNLPPLNAGDRVVGATMLTYLNACYPATTVNVQKVTSSWNQSTVTWNNQPAVSSVISEYKHIPYTEEADADFLEWDVTTLVNEWYLGTSPNYGIMLTSPAENSTSMHRARFYSTGYTTATVARPLLMVAIRNMSGFEDYYSYSSFSAGTAGTAYVNDFTGNLVFMHNTVNTTGVLMPVSVSEVFNTTGAGHYPDTYPNVGRGKKLNVQQTLRPSSYYGFTGESLEMFPYVYEDGDGTIHYFYKETKDGVTRYIDEDGLNLELTVNDASYKITDKSGNVLTFNKSTGLLTSTANADGISAVFEYTPGTITTGLNAGKEKQFLKTITDGAGHKIELTYELTKGNLVSVKGPDDKITTYSYTNELNTGITYPDGTSSTYNYYSDGELMWAQSADGYKLSFTYINSDGTKRVREVNESASGTTGQLVRFGFNSPYQTTIRNSGNDRVYGNSDDIRAVYQFDTYGRVSSVKTGLGNGETVAMGSYDFTMGSYADGTDIGKRNRIQSSSGIGKTVNNLLTNHSFESTNNWTASHWLENVYTENSTAEFVTTEKYIGSRSLKITVNTATVKGGYSMYQHAINRVTGGKTYTASVYVKTVNVTKMSTATVGGAGLGIRVVNASGGVSRLYSDLITGTTNTAIDGGWQRIEYTFTLPEGVTGLRITPHGLFCNRYGIF